MGRKEGDVDTSEVGDLHPFALFSDRLLIKPNSKLNPLFSLDLANEVVAKLFFCCEKRYYAYDFRNSKRKILNVSQRIHLRFFSCCFFVST